MAREAYAEKSVGKNVYSRLKNARVLLVGAGGIGCELLKNLVLVGVAEISVVDLDTIDLSNLNRQFLFSREHLKRPKAVVAKESASKFNPNVKITAFHSNIMGPQFNVKWFKSFDVVFNALDNKQAREHVNVMCLTSDVPLIESGTTGFDGYVQVIVGGKTECYSCLAKETPKTYAVCTIRSTPSQPVHCVVWSKSFLFSQLFEPEDEENALDEPDDAETVEEKDTLAEQSNELKDLRDRISQPGIETEVIEKLFNKDIRQLLKMESMWKSRIPPIPLDQHVIKDRTAAVDLSKVLANDQQPWSVEENIAVFYHALRALQTRLKKAPESPILFDKDDEDTLNFVVASANLRSLVFSIEVKSKFEIKQIAGNIIPAIATTNAIIAGMCVMQSLKVIQGSLDEAKNVYISQQPEKIFSVQKTLPPNPNCPISNVARATINVDIETATLRDLIDDVLPKYGYSEEITVLTDSLLYDIDFDDNVDKTFKMLGIVDGSFLTIVDDDEESNMQNLQFYVLAVEPKEGDDSTASIVLSSGPDSLGQKPKVESSAAERQESDDGDVDSGTKRKLDDANGGNGPGKRPKLDNSEDDELLQETVIISDDEDANFDGIIVLSEDED